jgi:hypothetical protein
MVTGSPRSLDQLKIAGPSLSHSDGNPEIETSITWTFSLLSSDPEKLPLVLAIISIAYVVSLWGLHNPLLAIVPTLLVVSSVSEYLFPICYTISSAGIKARWAWNDLEMKWVDVRHIYDVETGLKFSPLSRKNSLFEGIRGIRVRFDSAERRDEVLKAVAEWRKDKK